jgi:thymidylate kinase
VINDVPVVAMEGPCCAGKTTLGRALATALVDLTILEVPCFADHVGGGRFLPRPVPTSVAEDEQAIRSLLHVEAERTAYAPSQPYDLVLVDRSVYTLLAHRYALERSTGLGPDLVLYLDLPQEALEGRNHGKFEAGNIFIDRGYNADFRAFFAELVSEQPRLTVWLDATLTPTRLHEIAAERVLAMLRSAETGVPPRGSVAGATFEVNSEREHVEGHAI